MRKNDVLVVIPTYNEIESLPVIIDKIFKDNKKVDVLVVDDNSPDGTGKLADKMHKKDKRISVLHHQGKNGLGKAYIDGFKWGLDRKYKFLCEMDADGSHQPKFLPKMLELATKEKAGLVIGSRWIKGGSVVNWPKSREVLSRAGNLYIKIMMNLPAKDSTGGYRVYSAQTLKKINLDSIQSKGFGFQIDMTSRTAAIGEKIIETPIEFPERELGDSKMSGNIITEALFYVTKQGVRNRLLALKKRG